MKPYDTKWQVTTKKMMDGLYNDRFLSNTFLPLVIMQVFNVYINRQYMSFFIDVPTWCEEQRALKVLLSQVCAHFIDKRCQWLYKHAHVISIWRCVVAKGESSCWLGVLSRGPPLSLFDMLFFGQHEVQEIDVPLPSFFCWSSWT